MQRALWAASTAAELSCKHFAVSEHCHSVPLPLQNWLMQQKEFANLNAVEPNCYIQVQLDGTVRSSGIGTPPWSKLVDDLPELSDLRTRLMDGVGPQD